MPLPIRSEEHTSELQSHDNLVCRLLLEKKKERQVKLVQLVSSASYALPAAYTAVRVRVACTARGRAASSARDHCCTRCGGGRAGRFTGGPARARGGARGRE